MKIVNSLINQKPICSPPKNRSFASPLKFMAKETFTRAALGATPGLGAFANGIAMTNQDKFGRCFHLGGALANLYGTAVASSAVIASLTGAGSGPTTVGLALGLTMLAASGVTLASSMWRS